MCETRPNQRSDERSCNIQEDIVDGRRARLNECLVKFVARGKKCATQQNCAKTHYCFRPERRKATERTPQQKSQNRIFGDVRAFPDENEDNPLCVRGYPRVQPEQRRNNITRRVLGRHEIGGADKHHAEPNQQRQPILKEASHFGCGASVSGTKIDGVSQKRPTNLPI